MAQNRKAYLVRAAKARATLTAALKDRLVPASIREITEVIKPLGYTIPSAGSLVARMVENKLLTKVPVEHPDLKFGFLLRHSVSEEPQAPQESKAPVKHHKVVQPPEDIKTFDVQLNKDGSITVRSNSLAVTVRKEN
jgi:hypothetical protein